MITPTRGQPVVTPLQCMYLDILADGKLTGRQMRTRLRLRGVFRNQGAFFRVIQRLKRANLVTAERVPHKKGAPRGPQCEYRLTQLGEAAIRPPHEFHAVEYGAPGAEQYRRLKEMAWRLCLP